MNYELSKKKQMEQEIDPLRLLENLVEAQKRAKYPAVPGHARTKERFNDNTTNGLTRAVLKAFEIHGLFSTRLNSTGSYRADIGKFVPSQQRKGLPDVFAIVNGKAVYVEIKCLATCDRLRPEQKETIEVLRKSGARVFICEQYGPFWTWLLDLLKEENLSTSLMDAEKTEEDRARAVVLGHEPSEKSKRKRTKRNQGEATGGGVQGDSKHTGTYYITKSDNDKATGNG